MPPICQVNAELRTGIEFQLSGLALAAINYSNKRNKCRTMSSSQINRIYSLNKGNIIFNPTRYDRNFNLVSSNCKARSRATTS